MLDEVRPRLWIHGRHHRRHTETITTGHGNVEVISLAADGSTFEDATMTVDTRGKSLSP